MGNIHPRIHSIASGGREREKLIELGRRRDGPGTED